MQIRALLSSFFGPSKKRSAKYWPQPRRKFRSSGPSSGLKRVLIRNERPTGTRLAIFFYKSLSDTPRTYVAPRPRCLHHDDDMFAKFFSYVQIQSTLQCTQHGRKANIYLCTVMHREFSPDTVLIQDIDILFPLSYGRVG